MVVLTDYNNKFYRIDDVDFSQTPSSTFETRNGPQNFLDYYKAVKICFIFLLIINNCTHYLLY